MKNNKIFDHKTFLENLMLIESESERNEAVKNYIDTLPALEFEGFIRYQLKDIGTGLQELLATNSLNSDERDHILHKMDETIELIREMKEDLNVNQRKAA